MGDHRKGAERGEKDILFGIFRGDEPFADRRSARLLGQQRQKQDLQNDKKDKKRGEGMKRGFICFFILIGLTLCFFVSCSIEEYEVIGKTYVYEKEGFDFGGVKPMDPFVRREVLSHLGYQRLNFSYVHPSWKNDGEAVRGLDFCFMPIDESTTEIPAKLVVDFLTDYYSVLSNKPQEWLQMIADLKGKETVKLLPL